MAYFHGVKASEVATSIITPVATNAGLPVVFGTAPVHLTDDPSAYVNKPVICFSFKEAVEALGYSADWENYTLCEAMYSEFQLFGVQPIIFVNVLDPAKHKADVEADEVAVTAKVVKVAEPVLLSTLVVRAAAAAQPATLDVDYTAAFNDDGELVITLLEDGALESATSIFLDYTKLDPSAVTDTDIIGGVDSDGNAKGLELLNTIYTMFSMVPGLVLAPGWTEHPAVASVLKAKAMVINNLFRCLCLTDVDTTTVKKYSDVNTWKNNNSYTSPNQVVCWPMVKNGDAIFHLSTQLMGLIGKLDAANSDVPYQSPSNQDLNATGLCLADGTEVILTLEQANLLNSQGVYTAINRGGWKGWGNYTGAYPTNTDVKDSFIAVRRMFDWDEQTFILTYWQKVDQPLTRRLVKSIVDSEQIRLNGLVSRGFMLGAQVKFLEAENPTTDLLQGIIRVHKYITPPVPAQVIESIEEYDVNNFTALFSD